MSNYWQAFLHGGVVTVEQDEEGDYWIDIRSGFMNGRMMISEEELIKLRSFLKRIPT